MSNQWVGKGLRNRSHHPVRVTIECRDVTDEAFGRAADIRIKFIAWRPGGEYQSLHLSEAEADEVAATVVSCMSEREREKLVTSLLPELSDKKLLRALALDLKKRVRLPKDS